MKDRSDLQSSHFELGQGGFGGGGGGCNTGGGGGGFAGGDTRATKSNGEGGTSYVWMKRSVPELTSVIAGDNSGNGMVIIIRAINSPGCGCDYRCVVLDEYGANVACICPEGSRLKKDNLTACESESIQWAKCVDCDTNP